MNGTTGVGGVDLQAWPGAGSGISHCGWDP